MADLFAKASCTYCQEEINGVRVQCCVCQGFDICLQCFSLGAEIGPHKNDHAYKFVDHCEVSIFGGKGNWTGREELQLLDAVESYGFGNWENVSSSIETRTPEEVKEEYISRYIDGSIGKATWEEARKNQSLLNDHVCEDRGPLAPEVTSRLPPLDCSPEEAELIGYMSYRDDYIRECEYDMEAEQLVSSLQLSPTDTDVEIALKLAQVDMYIRRLRERSRRKRLVRDYQLVSKFFSTQRKEVSKKPLTKEQLQFCEKMRVFTQFLTSGEHERMIESIEKERELRHRLAELLKYRGLGLSTQEEIIHYEQHVAYQRQQQIRQKAGNSGSVIPQTRMPMAEALMAEQLSKNGSEEGDLNFIERRCMLLQEDEEGLLAGEMLLHQQRNYANNSLLLNSSQGLEMDNNLITTTTTTITNTPVITTTTTTTTVEPPALEALPFGSLLSENEVQLCTNLQLEPVQYMTLKGLIIQENLSGGKSQLKTESQETNEVSVKEVVTQYLHTSGWLSDVPVV